MDKNNLLKKLELTARLIAEMRDELVGKSMQEREIARTDDQVADFVTKKICLKCGKPLGDKKPTRGIHEKCYQQLRRTDELERALVNGRILHAAKPGPKSTDPLEPLIEKTIAKKRVANDKTTARDGH